MLRHGGRQPETDQSRQGDRNVSNCGGRGRKLSTAQLNPARFYLRTSAPFCYAPPNAILGGTPMAFCKACGQDIGTSAFCPKCGANQASAVAANPGPAAAPSSEGIAENLAGLLCYILSWLSGLIFLLIDKRPFVRFHAAQSIALSVAVFVVYFAVAIVFGMLSFMHLGFLALAVWPLLGFAIFIVWIFLMYKAYQHEKFKLPIIGNLVEGMLNK